MARPLRLEFPGALYHITSRGDRREDIYEDDTDRDRFLEIFASVITRFNWTCYAYCLMDNHYHLLLKTPDGNLSKGMRQLNGVYTQAYNRRHGKSGHLFQGRYKAILVNEDAYLLELSRYIVLNPVKADKVKQAGDWPWSSYRSITGKIPSPEWLSGDYLLAQFGKERRTAIKQYKAFVLAGLKNGPIWGKVSNQIYLGDASFINKVQQYLADQRVDLQIPKARKRAKRRPIAYYEKVASNRNNAIIDAYASGCYSYQQLGAYFGLHFTTIGKVIRAE